MDPVTHILSGGVAGQGVRNRFPGKAIVPFGMLAAWIPDIDNFLSGDPEFYLLYHRAFTHSFLGAIATAFVLAVIFWWFKRKTWRFWPLFLFGYACGLLHVFLDWINNYGTLVFAPFSNYRASLGSVFIIDPILTGTLLALFVGSLFVRRPKKVFFGAVGIAFALVYPFFNFGVKTSLENRLADELEAEGIHADAVTLSPDFLTPFRWKVVVETGDEYRIGPYVAFGDRAPEFESHRKADRDKLRRLGEKESFFATYEWFAVYIVMDEEELDDGNRRLLYHDLRFKSLHPAVRRVRPDEARPMFSVEAEVDRDGNLLAWTYRGPGRALEE